MKRAMREQSAEFAGEVSGHYYFREFYNADSGTIPALLVLELLSKRGPAAVGAGRRPALGVLHQRRDQLDRRRRRREDEGDRGGPSGCRDLLARRRLRRLPGLALQRAALEHRAAAAPQPRVARSRARTWRPSATRCWPSSAARTGRDGGRPRQTGSGRPRSRRRGADRRHEVELWRRIVGAGFKLMRIPTPFQVGRVNCWLIEDEPLTLIDAGPELGQVAGRARAPARRARLRLRRHRADHRQPPAHRPPRPRRRRPPALAAPRSSRSSSSSPSSTTTTARPSSTTPSRSS